MSDRELEWIDADGVAAPPTEELVLGTRRSRRARVRLVIAAAILLGAGATALVVTRSPAGHAPPVTRSSSRPVAAPPREVLLASELVPTGDFSQRSLPGASEEYRITLQNVSSHPLGPVGDIQVLFPGQLNGSVVSTEIVPADIADPAPGDATPAPLSFIRPGAQVDLLVTFSWFCPAEPVRPPRSGPTTVRVQVAMAAFRAPAVYDIDRIGGDDAFTMNRVDCGLP